MDCTAPHLPQEGCRDSKSTTWIPVQYIYIRRPSVVQFMHAHLPGGERGGSAVCRHRHGKVVGVIGCFVCFNVEEMEGE